MASRRGLDRESRRARIGAEPDGEGHALDLLRAASGRRLVAMHAIIVIVLLATAQVYDGSIHGVSHWIVLAAYALCSIWLGLAERRASRLGPDARSGRRAEWLAWASTVLNATVVVYVEVEHMLAGAVPGFDDAAGTVSRLPAFLLLLQTALTMRVWHTALFAGIVTLAWGGTLAIAFRAAGLTLGPHVSLAEEIPALLTFVAASVVVIDGVRRLRSAMAAALRLEHERTLLARFVPDGVAVSLAREGGLDPVRERHACLLALDIRGFSALSREQPRREVVRALLDIRAMAHEAVTEHGGIVDKYVGDGMLAQFLVGPEQAQARDALACARAILARLEDLNAKRRTEGLPPLRLTLALHAGEVLAGVFDDGLRAEFTVLGPPMNTLARLEAQAKRADLTLGASGTFLDLLEDGAEGARIVPVPGEERTALFAVPEVAAARSAVAQEA